jgi:hypothetical protein
MSQFWRLVLVYEALLLGGIVLAALPTWLLEGIPHHQEAFWDQLMVWGWLGTFLISAFATKVTTYCGRGEDAPRA